MKFTKRYTLLALAATMVLGACHQSKFEGFDDTESGLSYKFIIKNDGNKPKENDILTFKLKYYTDKDSLLFDSKSIGRPFKVKNEKPAYKGSFQEGFNMMSIGDSAMFMVSADSFFTKIIGSKDFPPFVKKGSFLKFCFKLEKIQSQAEIDKENQQLMTSKLAEEKKIIEQYVAENKITETPTESGLYFMEKHQGSGAQVKPGDTVYVKYTGKTLDGNIFDSSDKSPTPIKFQIGVGQVIRGWDEALVKMKVGSKATLLIPSSSAYGERGMPPQIQPFSPLLFDVEVYKIGGKK